MLADTMSPKASVWLGGLQDHDRPVRACTLEVEDHPLVVGPRVVLNETFRPEADPLLRVGEQEDHVVL